MMGLRRTSRRADDALALESRGVGHALLIGPKGALSQQALTFAEGLPADPEHHLVVLDLPADVTDATWPVLARMLGRRAGSYRLIFGRQPPGGTVPIGQWLADQLDQVVIVAKGEIRPGAGGVLLVPADNESGWYRLQSRQAGTRVAQRFPRPGWEHTVKDAAWKTGETTLAEALPGGVWLHGPAEPAQLALHRRQLTSRMAYREDFLTVVLGSPSTPPLSVADISRFWETVHPDIRPTVRFVPYGPLNARPGHAPGQVLARLLDAPVVLYNGLPVSHVLGQEPEVHALGLDGSLGWATFARELQYSPTSVTPAVAPSVLTHRPLPADLPQISPGVFEYDTDAVLEVVPSGLWLRPPGEQPTGAATIRSVRPHPRRANIIFGSQVHSNHRMRELAETLLDQLDPVTRSLAELLSAGELMRTSSSLGAEAPEFASAGGQPATMQTASLDHGFASTARPESSTLPRTAAAPGSGAADAGEPPRPLMGASTSASGVATAASVIELPAKAATEAADPQHSHVEEPPQNAGPIPSRGPDTTSVHANAPTPSGLPAAPSGSTTASLRLVSAPLTTSSRSPLAGTAFPSASPTSSPAVGVQPVAPEAPTAPPASAPPAPGAPLAPQPTSRSTGHPAAPLVQERPTPDASAVRPAGGIEAERAWLRETYREQYQNNAGLVSRRLSQAPGLRGAGKESTEDITTDLIAAHLYLHSDSAPVDRMIRETIAGPHVSFARCAAAGLRRLPTYRGAAMLRATLNEAEWAWYAKQRVVAEWGFGWALASSAVELPGDVDFLIWSLTGRRTALLDPDLPERVVFLPGTHLRVLEIQDGERRAVLLRELSVAELAAVEAGATPPTALSTAADEAALLGLETFIAAPRQVSGVLRNASPEAVARFTTPPGLIAAAG